MKLLIACDHNYFIEFLQSDCDGLILDTTVDKVAYYYTLAKENNKEFYWDLRRFFKEDELDYLKIEVPVFYTDLGIYHLLKERNNLSSSFYDGGPLIANSVDASFYAHNNKGVVLGRELNYEELKQISTIVKGNVAVQVFGYLLEAISGRKYISSFFEYYGLEKKEGNYQIKEKRRDFYQPISEDEGGSRLYSPYIYLPHPYLDQLKEMFNYGLIETRFLQKDTILDFISLFNKKISADEFLNKYSDLEFGYPYLERKVGLFK